jgi:hypothetical protein
MFRRSKSFASPGSHHLSFYLSPVATSDLKAICQAGGYRSDILAVEATLADYAARLRSKRSKKAQEPE